MEFSWLSALFGAFGISMAKLTWNIAKYFIMRSDSNKYAEHKYKTRQLQIEQLFNDLLVGAVQIQVLIEQFLVDNNADRVLVLRMENGGGVPQLGTPQHISVLYEVINNDHVSPVKSDFQNYTIDAEYQKMLMQVITDGMIEYTTSDMVEGMLKNIFIAHNITKSLITSVTNVPSLGEKQSKGFLIYTSIQFVDDRVIDAKIQSDVAILKDKIAQIFHTFYVKRVNLLNDND